MYSNYICTLQVGSDNVLLTLSVLYRLDPTMYSNYICTLQVGSDNVL